MGRVSIRKGKRCITFLGVHLPYEYEETPRTIHITIHDISGSIYLRHVFNKNTLIPIDWNFMPSVFLMYDRLCYDTILFLNSDNINKLFSQYQSCAFTL